MCYLQFRRLEVECRVHYQGASHCTTCAGGGGGEVGGDIIYLIPYGSVTF